MLIKNRLNGVVATTDEQIFGLNIGSNSDTKNPITRQFIEKIRFFVALVFIILSILCARMALNARDIFRIILPSILRIFISTKRRVQVSQKIFGYKIFDRNRLISTWCTGFLPRKREFVFSLCADTST